MGIAEEVEPPNVLVAPLKVCRPVLAVKVVALFVKLPAKFKIAAALSFQMAPLFKMTSPVKVLVPVALLKLMVPEIVEVPETLMVKAPTVRVDPFAIDRLPITAVFISTVTVKPPSMVTISPTAGTVAPAAPPEVAAQVEVLLQLPDATEKRFKAFS